MNELSDFVLIDDPSISGGGNITAHYYGCDLVGCEIDGKQYNKTMERFVAETQQLALLDT